MTVTPEKREHIEKYMRNPLLPAFMEITSWRAICYDGWNGVYMSSVYPSRDEAMECCGAFDAVSATFRYELPVIENRY